MSHVKACPPCRGGLAGLSAFLLVRRLHGELEGLKPFLSRGGGENGAVLVLMVRAKRKENLFCHGEVFFLLPARHIFGGTRPLGDPSMLVFHLAQLVGNIP